MDNTHPLIPFEKLAVPAQRALKSAGYETLNQISKVGEKEISRLHGIGPNAVKILRKILSEHNLEFAKRE
jgi:ERCC4-type nuclease